MPLRVGGARVAAAVHGAEEAGGARAAADEEPAAARCGAGAARHHRVARHQRGRLLGGQPDYLVSCMVVTECFFEGNLLPNFKNNGRLHAYIV